MREEDLLIIQGFEIECLLEHCYRKRLQNRSHIYKEDTCRTKNKTNRRS